MANSARILGVSAGSLDASVMFVGEAPGRLGADSTGIPFHGDKAGDNFEDLLGFAGLSREDIYVTNAVLCNPKDDKGNNGTPTPQEIRNCSDFLRRQIDLVEPKIVVTLGASAMKGVSSIEEHGLTLRNDVRTAKLWYRRKLVPLYHPGQRAMIHRSLPNQRSDYQFVAETLRRIGIKLRKMQGKTQESLAAIVKEILRTSGELSYFALHKIVFLLEVANLESKEERLTGAYFIRQKDGPYCTDLQIRRLKNAIPEIVIHSGQSKLYLSLQDSDLFLGEAALRDAPEVLDRVLRDKLRELARKSDSELKTKAYLTRQMKALLKLEKLGANMYNASIF